MTGESRPGTVTIVGGGYIGYPLAVLVASVGFDVLVADTHPSVVSEIQAGVPRTTEAALAKLAADERVRDKLRAAAEPSPADVFIIAVPTPLLADLPHADLSMVEEATRSIVPHLTEGDLVIVESTIPPGTTEHLVAPILSASGLEIGRQVQLAHCPERLHPGATLQELRENDRIVGGIDAASAGSARAFYERFTIGEVVETDALTAELAKLFENTYRDVNLALTNQLAGIAEHLGASAPLALELASRHPRVEFLRPGIGVGGHCIPVDPWFLHQVAPDLATLVAAARQVNDEREKLVAQRIEDHLRSAGGDTVVIAGAAFKPNVSDQRGSPALAIARRLRDSGVDVRIHDPLIDEFAAPLSSVAADADLLAILVPHDRLLEEIAASRSELEEVMRRTVFLDFSTGWPEPV